MSACQKYLFVLLYALLSINRLFMLNHMEIGGNMKGKFNSEIGDIYIDNSVVAKCAGNIAIECFGIVGMATVSVTDGIVKLVRRENLTKGINVEIDDNNEITIDFHVIVAYGVSISAVSDNLISTVKYQVEEITGLTVKKINIFVEGVRVID